MIPFEERRAQRSENRDLALGFQLAHVRDRARLEALVLADDDGLALSAAGDPPLLRGAEVAVRIVHVHGQPLYLASVGGGVARDALLAHSLGGVRRILACN